MSKSLSDRKLQSKLKPGRYFDNNQTGLHLHVRASGSKAWVQRARINRKYVDLGLGNYPAVTLQKARQTALRNKSLIIEGKDPRSERTKHADIPTFEQVALLVIEKKKTELSNAKSKAQWAATIETYALPVLGSLRIDQIEVSHVQTVLNPIWQDKFETARRLRGRLEAIFDHAIASQYRTLPNPAAWKGNLQSILPAKPKRSNNNRQPALQIKDGPRWWSELSQRDGMGARALQFLALTGSRSGEVRGMKWDEIHDIDKPGKAVWTIPPHRMKMNKEHRVPLTPMMQDVLISIMHHSISDLVFPSKTGTQLSDMTLSGMMKRIHDSDIKSGGTGFIDMTSRRPAVPHGIRSTFRDWAAEQGYESDMAEIQLAHDVGSAVTRAYRRTDMIEKRRKMMVEWGNFWVGKK